MDPFTLLAGGLASIFSVGSSFVLSIGVGTVASQNNKFPQPEDEDFSLGRKKTLIAAREILKSADVMESKPNNGIKGRFIKISNPYNVCMHIANVIVSTNKNDNIAFEKPVAVSSVLDRTDKFKPSNVTDGDKNTFSHTSCGEQPWIIIDLQFVADIIRITVVNRQDCCQQRLNGTIVSLLGEQHETVWESDPFTDGQGSSFPVFDSNLNQFGFDSFTMMLPSTGVTGEKNKYY